jgi:hypothetical protein
VGPKWWLPVDADDLTSQAARHEDAGGAIYIAIEDAQGWCIEGEPQFGYARSLGKGLFAFVPEKETPVRLGRRTHLFLQAEVRNEKHGGVSPTTVRSATDSLMQWPTDPFDELFPDASAQQEVAFDLLSLAFRHGMYAGLEALGIV